MKDSITKAKAQEIWDECKDTITLAKYKGRNTHLPAVNMDDIFGDADRLPVGKVVRKLVAIIREIE